ncbi:hypothetical protein WJX72_011241 [[Myrmecia] bisecta]|uniref:Regulatory particle non-ATPase 13 n=1 Tax=[Myrmecia] bisecta TaxID=41462 RepID=A0AAW1PI33_9CHLO
MAAGAQVLVEFKTGRLSLDQGKLVPDPRKGLLRVIKEDSLVHVQWFERSASGTAAEPETDIILFPGDAQLAAIGPANGRMYRLGFQEKDRDLFFWLQEPASQAQSDEQLCARVNQAFDSFTPEDDGDVDEADEMETSTSDAGVAAAAAGDQEAFSAVGAGRGVQATDLASILSNMGLPQPGSQQTQGMSTQQQAAAAAALLASMTGSQRRQQQGPSLSQVLKAEHILPVLSEPGVLERLAPHLPEEHRTAAALREVATSAQFRHQLDVFSSALQSGQLDLAQFGLGQGQGFSVVDFLESIQQLVDQERAEGNSAAP